MSSVVPAVTPKIIAAAVVGVLSKIIHDDYLSSQVSVGTSFSFVPFTALGVAISLFLGFHNNASYNRWWEARILWGTQVITVRDILRFTLGSLGPCDTDEEQPDHSGEWRKQLCLLSMAQTHAFRAQMRPYCQQDEPTSAIHDRDRFLTEEQLKVVSKSKNPANMILHQMGIIIGKAHSNSWIDSYSMVHLSKQVEELCRIQTGCERIHNTSLPLPYSLLVHRTAFLYVLLAPFAIVDEMGWWTPVFTAILAYTFFGLDELARQIQEPFRDEPQCLALSAICRTIEIDACEALGLPVPPKLEPERSVLM